MLPKSTGNEGALVAFVGTLGSGLTWAGSIVVNPLMTRLGTRGTRYICIMGVVCMSLGFGLASVCQEVRYITALPLYSKLIRCNRSGSFY